MARVVNEKEYAIRKKEIIDAAQRFIYSKGYEQMSIQDILNELHISKGAFYHYFGSKQTLIEAIIARMGEETNKKIQPVVNDLNLTAIQKLQRFLTIFDSFRIENKADLVELLRIWYTDNNAFIRQKVDEVVIRQRVPLLNEIVRQGIREGLFTTAYPDHAGEIILYLLQGMGVTHARLLLSLDKEYDEQRCIENIVTTHACYMDAIERVLGIPLNSLYRADVEAAKVWVDAFNPYPGTTV
jgi:TetR/AcrR family transcriptional repressor of nem operon